MNFHDPNAVYTWTYGQAKPVAYLLLMAVSIVVLSLVLILSIEEVSCWCFTSIGEGCFVLAIFGIILVYLAWGIKLLLTSFSTVVGISIRHSSFVLQFPFAVTKTFPLVSMRSLKKVDGSKWNPHPLYNRDGVIELEIGSRTYWVNPGEKIDEIVASLERAQQGVTILDERSLE